MIPVKHKPFFYLVLSAILIGIDVTTGAQEVIIPDSGLDSALREGLRRTVEAHGPTASKGRPRRSR